MPKRIIVPLNMPMGVKTSAIIMDETQEVEAKRLRKTTISSIIQYRKLSPNTILIVKNSNQESMRDCMKTGNHNEVLLKHIALMNKQ